MYVPAGVGAAFSRSVQEQQTRLTPPPRRAPPGQYTGTRQACPRGDGTAPGFDANWGFRRFDGRRLANPATALWSVFLVPTW